MHQTPAPAAANTATGNDPVKLAAGGTIASNGTHVWGRCSADPRLWSVIPIDPREPVYRAVQDDFGMLVPVGVVQ